MHRALLLLLKKSPVSSVEPEGGGGRLDAVEVSKVPCAVKLEGDLSWASSTHVGNGALCKSSVLLRSSLPIAAHIRHPTILLPWLLLRGLRSASASQAAQSLAPNRLAPSSVLTASPTPRKLMKRSRSLSLIIDHRLHQFASQRARRSVRSAIGVRVRFSDRDPKSKSSALRCERGLKSARGFEDGMMLLMNRRQNEAESSAGCRRRRRRRSAPRPHQTSPSRIFRTAPFSLFVLPRGVGRRLAIKESLLPPHIMQTCRGRLQLPKAWAFSFKLVQCGCLHTGLHRLAPDSLREARGHLSRLEQATSDHDDDCSTALSHIDGATCSDGRSTEGRMTVRRREWRTRCAMSVGEQIAFLGAAEIGDEQCISLRRRQGSRSDQVDQFSAG